MKRLLLLMLAAILGMALLPAAAFAYAPTPVSPPNQSTVTPNAPNGWYPYLKWNGSNDLTTYMIEIASKPDQLTDGGFVPDNVVLGQYGIFNHYYDWGADNLTSFPTYLTPGTYYWHVLDMFPMDSTGFSPWSQTWSFTVPSPAPEPPGPLQYSMNIQPKALTWEMTQGDPASAKLPVVFDCTGPTQTTYYIGFTVPSESWVHAFGPGADGKTFYFQADPTGLAPGTYRSRFNVTLALDHGLTQQILGSPYAYALTLVVKAKPGTAYVVPNRPACALTAPTVKGKASAKKGTTLTGTLTPAHSTPLTIEVQRLVKHKYKAFKKLVASSNSSGAWSLKYKLPKSTYRVRATSADYPTYQAGASGWRKIVVK